MIDSVFVIKGTDLVFFGQLTDNPIEDLETVLGQILGKAKDQPPGTQKLMALKQGKFLFTVYPSFYIIVALSKGTEKDIADKIIKQLGDRFQTNFEPKLASYSGDNSIFASFSSDIQTVLTSFLSKPAAEPSAEAIIEASKTEELEAQTEFVKEPPSITPEPAIAENNPDTAATSTEDDTGKTIKPGPSPNIPLSQRKGMIEIKKSTVVVEALTGDKPIVTPEKRQAYPDGIPEYARDEVLFNESFEVQKNFECELVDYSVSDVKIVMNISLTHIYEVEINFTDYPERPKVILGETLQKELGKPIEEISYILKHWDPKIPAHIKEIVYELEKILTRFKSEGKLSPTQEMPSYAIPELEPLKGDIKWDPNVKPKKIEVPEYIPPEIETKSTNETPTARSAPVVSGDDLHLNKEKYRPIIEKVIDKNFNKALEIAIAKKDLNQVLKACVIKAKNSSSQFKLSNPETAELAYEIFLNVFDSIKFPPDQKLTMARTVSQKLHQEIMGTSTTLPPPPGKLDPKQEKARKEMEEKKRKEAEKQAKEDEKRKKEEEKNAAKQKKELEKLKKEEKKIEEKQKQMEQMEKDES